MNASEGVGGARGSRHGLSSRSFVYVDHPVEAPAKEKIKERAKHVTSESITATGTGYSSPGQISRSAMVQSTNAT